MAGGGSTRMRATMGPLHKALVPVSGVPLLDRNLRTLEAQGFSDIIVAVNVSEPDLGRHVTLRGRRVLWEEVPLGTIGAARLAIGEADSLLIVNVDNLTSLSLNSLVNFHKEKEASMTIATHQEPFQIPFGELALTHETVDAYIEKPVKPVWISSGTYVLSPEACAMIPEGRRVDVPELVAILIAAGKQVAAFRHQSAWIDVNQADAIPRAEQIAGSNI
jgi:NDP-sugar pyrophosphorylase family protein